MSAVSSASNRIMSRRMADGMGRAVMPSRRVQQLTRQIF